MTKDEIVAALRCCAKRISSCEKCVLLLEPNCLVEIKAAAADLIENQQNHIAALMQANASLRNELCQYCGKYKKAHEGACDGCRWKQ